MAPRAPTRTRRMRELQLPAGKVDDVWFDREFGGFGVRLRAGGARSWIVQYDFGGKAHKMTPAQSTVESWRTVFNALTRDFPDRSASAIKPEEAQQWLDTLITKERSAFTVHNTWLRATRTVFAWGARRKLTSNPFREAVVDVPRRKQFRPKWLYEHERTTILRAAAAIAKIDGPDDAACRWVPWLLAYTGARPQDITQLRGKDEQQVDGIWIINVTPEAGTVKNATARQVPLHEHLIEQGFLDFVKESGEGPLFYRPRRKQPDDTEPTKEAKAPAAQARQRLAAWVRKIGVNDVNLSPNHAWRHTFKLVGRRIEQEDTMLDYICGHAPATTGREYGEPTLKDLARVIERFPRYET
jgi:integrase